MEPVRKNVVLIQILCYSGALVLGAAFADKVDKIWLKEKTACIGSNFDAS